MYISTISTTDNIQVVQPKYFFPNDMSLHFLFMNQTSQLTRLDSFKDYHQCQV